MAPLRRALQLAAHAAVVVASSSHGRVLADATTRGGEVKIEKEKNKADPTDEGGCDGSDKTCSMPTSRDHLEQCGVWLAPSSLPGAGLGMFAGRDFKKFEPMLQSGDVVIPIVDIMMHQKGRKRFTFLWDEYTWVSCRKRVRVFQIELDDAHGRK